MARLGARPSQAQRFELVGQQALFAEEQRVVGL
jgi:hypothetical protein